ncbi:succinate dehydrogenase cytochrome b560 subunit [Penicillium frequentans]|uniref:Succinate dehydrogenase cytochrome b560 subunit n=1 Tax=Penicillium frequentans TaxID=3151616 RepID=A0AAD6CTU9_9EURO|nr:succinate dehydrogenase cytochrome b560 subunit [Penicillium glabrum]
MLLRASRHIPTTARLFRVNGVTFRRNVSTQNIPTESPHHRLAAQRLNRPVSPHISIYKWQFVSSASILHRITGILLSGSLYAFGTLYLLSPNLGIHLDSTTMVDAFGALPTAVKIGVKFGTTMPFTYHAFNGMKQLVWDTGRLLGKKQNGRASWAVLVCSISASLGLALYKPGDEEDVQ